MSASSVNESLARQLKATKFADLLDAVHVSGATAAVLTPTEWNNIALLIGSTPPSSETQALTVQLLQAREDARRRITECLTSPKSSTGNKAA